MTIAPKQRTIALDFDGVVHAYTSPWTSPLDIHDEPVPGALAFIRCRLAAGWVIILHTARFMHNVPLHLTAVEEIDLDSRANAVLVWFVLHGGDDIVASENFHLWLHGGKPHADVYLDDRALRFDGVFPGEAALAAAAVTWNKPGAAGDLPKPADRIHRIKRVRELAGRCDLSVAYDAIRATNWDVDAAVAKIVTDRT